MDGEQLLIDGGIVAGFLALITFWIGIAMWMWADAEKHGRAGWFWSYVGLLGGPVGLVCYLFYRGNQPVLPTPVAPTEAVVEPPSNISGQPKFD